MRKGYTRILLSCHCVLCYHNNNTVLQQPTLLWFGVGSHAPCVRLSPGVVVEKVMVQLDEDRKSWYEGVDDKGSRVLFWEWGGKDDNRAVKVVAVADGGMELEQGGVTVLYGEEQRIDDAGKAEDFILDFNTEIYF